MCCGERATGRLGTGPRPTTTVGVTPILTTGNRVVAVFIGIALSATLRLRGDSRQVIIQANRRQVRMVPAGPYRQFRRRAHLCFDFLIRALTGVNGLMLKAGLTLREVVSQKVEVYSVVR